MPSKIQMFVEADNVAELHAKVLGMLGQVGERDTGCNAPADPTVPVKASPEPNAPAADPVPTAEVVPMAERKKPGRPKKTETVVEAEPAKEPVISVEDARAILKEIQTKIGNEEARQLNKKHGEEPLSEKKPAQWAAIIAEGKALLAALEE